MIPAIRGFILDCRLSIATKSDMAANVVPKPAVMRSIAFPDYQLLCALDKPDDEEEHYRADCRHNDAAQEPPAS